jgi:3-oxoacyl-[acyl-carrier-protein] synthase-3
MARANIDGIQIAGIATSTPADRFDNLKDTADFTPEEVKKVVGMAGIKERRLANEDTCSSDLCIAAGRALLDEIGWDPGSVEALIFVTQSPDYFLPQTSSIIHQALSLNEDCAAFDVGLGCSGYPYGLWLAAMMIKSSGFKRVLLCHGETPGRFSLGGDRAVALLFGDAGSATAIEASDKNGSVPSTYVLQTDSRGCTDMIIAGGGFRNRFPEDKSMFFVKMDGANIFNFTLKRVPGLINDTLEKAEVTKEEIDYYIFHQSNLFIMKHLANKIGIPIEKIPVIIDRFGNTGGPSIPLTITQSKLDMPEDRDMRLMLVAYGVGLSWASALIHLNKDVVFKHVDYQ